MYDHSWMKNSLNSQIKTNLNYFKVTLLLSDTATSQFIPILNNASLSGFKEVFILNMTSWFTVQFSIKIP